MLVLSRQKDESIIIAPDPEDDSNQITVTVIDVRGDKVRLGFEAPRSTRVHRKEIWVAIMKEKKASSDPE